MKDYLFRFRESAKIKYVYLGYFDGPAQNVYDFISLQESITANRNSIWSVCKVV